MYASKSWVQERRRIQDYFLKGFKILGVILLTGSLLAQSYHIVYSSPADSENIQVLTANNVFVPSWQDMNITDNCRIIHVAKEFGSAKIGGAGSVITTLASMTAKESPCEVIIIMPYYSFVRRSYLEKGKGNLKLYHTFQESFNFTFLEEDAEFNEDVADYLVQTAESPDLFRVEDRLLYFPINIYEREERLDANGVAIKTYLIDGPDYPLFHHAFLASANQKIYQIRSPWIRRWRDLYFARMAATLVGHLEEQEILARRKMSSVVQMHGATTATVSMFLRLNQALENVATVYTIHDYSYEFVIDYETFVLQCFGAEWDALGWYEDKWKHVFARRNFFPTAFPLLLADKLTFVSRIFVDEVAQGKANFPNQDIMLPQLRKRLKEGDLEGISNGIHLTSLNPFNDPHLRQYKLEYSLGRNSSEKFTK
jgi:glycogen synthase